MRDFDKTFLRLFKHFGFSDTQISEAIKIARKEDLSRMSHKQLRSRLHISSKQTTKWKRYFKDFHKDDFKRRFGDALIQLGYEVSNRW
jgi:hypothetical protein